MSPPIGAEALIANPALKPLEFLIGTWRTSGTHPLVPGETLSGRTVFSWHEGGAFMIMHSEVGHPLFPSGVAIIGGDGESGRFAMIYFDERSVSRLYDVELGDRTLTWRRDDPKLSQSMTIAAGEGGDTLVGKGRMSEDGGAWADDLCQDFVRDRP